ncbi:MAG: hypothetical protein NT136_02730 [Candidatus Moranbacteria bacterium]|nr:hypothetical protein [Candidatus Moranbacteria bacterium]
MAEKDLNRSIGEALKIIQDIEKSYGGILSTVQAIHNKEIKDEDFRAYTKANQFFQALSHV